MDRDWAVDVDGTVRFAVVGLGWFGRDKALPAIDGAEHAEATVAVSGSKDKARRVVDAHETLRTPLTYEEYHAGEAADAYDAVYVVTPNMLHLEAVETAASLGKDVLCEKPLEGTVERAEQLVAACADAGVRLMTAYRMHLEPITRRIRDAIDAGAIGEPIQLEGAFCGDALDGDPDQWRLDPELAGGGALYDLGIYPINTSRFLLGRDPVGVRASVVRNEPIMDGMDVHAAAQLEFPGGVTASCRTSYQSGGDSFVGVLGTDGRIWLEQAFHVNAERTLTVERGGVTTEAEIETNELIEVFEYFSTRVLDGEPIEPDGPHGLSDMRTMAAVYDADEREERISL